MYKIIFRTLLAAALSAAVSFGAQAAEKTLAITQIVEHPALDAARQGVIDELREAGFIEGENLEVEFQSAQGNPATAAQIARKFVGDRPDVIVAISTPSAQTVAAATKDIPIVFSAVSDPLAAKLVKDMEHPGGNITGVSDFSPIAEQLDLIREITPQVEALAVIYNAGEANSVALVEVFKQLAADKGFKVVEGVATRTSEVLGAARSVVGKADAIYLPLDNTVAAAVEAVIKVGIDARLPVYSADTAAVKSGALASLGFDYYDVGRQTGQQVARVLNGESPGDIPVERVKKLNLFLNLKAAEKMGVSVPQDVIDRAATLIE